MKESYDPYGRRMLHHLMGHLDLFPNLTWIVHLFKVNFQSLEFLKNTDCNSFTEALVTDVAKSSMVDI